MIYLTYAEYRAKGGMLDETAFNRNITRACGVIDRLTFNRIENMALVPDEVKECCRDIVEYFADNFGSSRQISSHNQSAGGVSEGESYVIRSAEERAGELTDMVKDYLISVKDDNGTPLLYRGCME